MAPGPHHRQPLRPAVDGDVEEAAPTRPEGEGEHAEQPARHVGDDHAHAAIVPHNARRAGLRAGRPSGATGPDLRGHRARRKMAPPPASHASAVVTGLKDPRAALLPQAHRRQDRQPRDHPGRRVRVAGTTDHAVDGARPSIAWCRAARCDGYAAARPARGAAGAAPSCKRRPRWPARLVSPTSRFASHGIAVLRFCSRTPTWPTAGATSTCPRDRRAVECAPSPSSRERHVSTEEIEFGDNDQLAATSPRYSVRPAGAAHRRARPARPRSSACQGHDLADIRGFIWQEENGVSLGGMASRWQRRARSSTRDPGRDRGGRRRRRARRILDGEDVSRCPAGRRQAREPQVLDRYTLKMRGALSSMTAPPGR